MSMCFALWNGMAPIHIIKTLLWCGFIENNTIIIMIMSIKDIFLLWIIMMDTFSYQNPIIFTLIHWIQLKILPTYSCSLILIDLKKW